MVEHTDGHRAVTFKEYVSDHREPTHEPRDGWTNRAEPSRMAEHTGGHHAWEVLDRALRGIGLAGATRVALDEPTVLSGTGAAESANR